MADRIAPQLLIAKWRREADDCELAALEADSIGLDKSAIVTDAHAKNLRACADELEAAMQAQQGAEPVATNAFHDGVILALQVMNAGGDTGSAHYVELVNCCGLDALVQRATTEEMMELSGLDTYLRDDRVIAATGAPR